MSNSNIDNLSDDRIHKAMEESIKDQMQYSKSNIDGWLIELLFGEEGLQEEDNSSLMRMIRSAQERKLKRAKQAIQQELLKARISELNKHIAWADENVGGITLSRQQLDDRIADLQAKLKENSDG